MLLKVSFYKVRTKLRNKDIWFMVRGTRKIVTRKIAPNPNPLPNPRVNLLGERGGDLPVTMVRYKTFKTFDSKQKTQKAQKYENLVFKKKLLKM